MRQAAGIAQSWRSNRANRWREYAEKLAWYESLTEQEQQARKKPVWNEPRLPELHTASIQASENVALQVEPNMVDVSIHKQNTNKQGDDPP